MGVFSIIFSLFSVPLAISAFPLSLFPYVLLLQNAKVLAKKELSYMPVIGWMWYFLEIVFCKRKWEEDRKTVMQGLLNLRDYPENFWVSVDSTVQLIHLKSLKGEKMQYKCIK